MKKSGFTLVELITTVAVVSAMLALYFVLSKHDQPSRFQATPVAAF